MQLFSKEQTEYLCAIEVIQRLERAGFEAYFVGGCVRDLLLNLPSNDYDIATNALPNQIRGLFERVIPTGEKFGVMTVLHDEFSFEVATFRRDLGCTDGRRPSVVEYSNSIATDLARRDLTINAMAMKLDGTIVDPFFGMDALKRRRIIFVGDPAMRLREDKLRALRAIRFATKYGFDLMQEDLPTLRSVSLSELSAERVRDEFNKILMLGDAPRGLSLLANLGLLTQITPSVASNIGYNQRSKFHSLDLFRHTLSVLGVMCAGGYDLETRLAAYFHDIAKPNVMSFTEGSAHYYGHEAASAEVVRMEMRRLRYSNSEIETVCKIIKMHMLDYRDITEASVKRLISKFNSFEELNRLFSLQLADSINLNGLGWKVDNTLKMRNACKQAFARKDSICFSLKNLAVNGNDLKAMGYSGKAIGSKLNELLNLVLEDERMNDRELLLKICK